MTVRVISSSWLLLAGAICLHLVFATNTHPIADIVFHNGSIHSLDEDSSIHSAMAIKDGYITFLGRDSCARSLIGPDTRLIDLEGRMAMPGLVDAHMHVLEGGSDLLKCSLNYQPLLLREVLSHIQSCLDTDVDKSDDDWLEVIALDYYTLTDSTGGVNKFDLDTLAARRPILVISADRHTRWVNSAALTGSGIDETTSDPAGGIIERLSGSREPSGILQDNAGGLLAGPAPPTLEHNLQAAKAALKLLREEGVTTFQDAEARETSAAAFAAIKDEGSLSARAYFDYVVTSPNSTTAVESLIDDIVNFTQKWDDGSEMNPRPTVKWQAAKLFMDGVILYPANTGAVIEPYLVPTGNGSVWEPDPRPKPEPYWASDILDLTIEQLILNQIDIQVHTDGDLAVRETLNSLERFRSSHGDEYDYRVGLAHNELTDPQDWPRFSKLKADPIMSFQWAQAMPEWIPNTLNSMGPIRSNYLEAWGSIAQSGSRIIYGSDWPIDPLDEWLTIKVAVTRSGDPTNPNSPASLGPPYDGPGLPGPTLTREQAIRAITIESSRFLRADKKIGSLEVGKLADVIILESNYFELPDEEIGRQKVLLTMLGGEVLYVSDGMSFGGIIPRFPNNDTLATALDKKRVGGVRGRSLAANGRQALQRVRPRGACGHGQLHRN
ncbi:amidohydrolase family-domain-containing protein [Stachybotrys elegans]|uniref:Amidohydrolase family-domain-containing protein n=1 Tax=Stachybotrys elegans TaxID=80388 RepID=A0A8K0WTH2_9HYPO|nr:amidohydrolase family-domain-containing protein [Stachybotrys elegans]